MNFGRLERTWVVAEIGVNHEGDEAVAVDLIAKAAEAGAEETPTTMCCSPPTC